jgi:sugar lactone lactonase YvrE
LGVVQSFGTSSGAKITTVVGNGTGGYNGDGIPATSAEISLPYGIALDSSGNLYIADNKNCLIRMVDTSGIIHTVAGNPALGPGYSGDGSAATAAQLNTPLAVAVDSSDNIYIADAGNDVVRMVDPTGVIHTVAGKQGSSSWNDGTGLSAESATAVDLGYPYSLAIDSSQNLYIADMYNSLVWKLTSGSIVTFAGSHLLGPGNAGDGKPATDAELNYPQGVAFDSSGNLYIADTSNCVIRKVNTSGVISTVAGNGISGYTGDGGPALAAQINYPSDVTVDSAGNLYFSDGEEYNTVRKVDTSGNINTVAGNVHMGGGYGGDGNTATAALLYGPWGLTLDLSGNLLIADRLNNRIRKVGFGN